MPKRGLVAAFAGAAALGVLVFVAVVQTGGGENGSAENRPALDDPGPVHVHGLGVNPADGALFIATHTGLYRAAPGRQRAARVGASLQDTMGFTVAGRDHFLGSGHPDPAAMAAGEWPPNLGLIESTDAGKSWRSVSLLGEADFHVLRSRGARVYGFDSSNARLLLSRDGGQTWDERATPAPLFDLVLDPTDASRVLAATERGLFVSSDSARSWRSVEGGLGLLAWPAPEGLYVVDGGGRIWSSAGPARRWRSVGEIGGQPAAFVAESARELYVALHDGTIKRSGDGGRTWTIRSAPG